MPDKNMAMFWTAAVIILITDQITKSLIRSKLIIGESAGLITRVENTGVAFGMFTDANWIFAVIALIVIVMLIVHRKKFEMAISALGAGLILGGASGNLMDRILFGAVTDFISIGWWPAFNVADASLTFGVILLLLWQR